MNTHTVSWLVLLTLMKNFSCVTNPFELEVNWIMAVEGSCVEIKCKPDRYVHGLDGAHWFWMKDATWKDETKDYVATTIYSTDESKRPVDPLFKNRVRQIDSSPLRLSSHSSAEKLCNILICDLQKTDSGNYSFRFHGKNLNKWVTTPGTNLTVVENPCPITFKGPQAVKENEMVTLTCVTLNSCPSNPQIDTSMQQPSIQMSKSLRTNAESPKSFTQIFNVSWKDDGIGFSCQTADNQEKYLIRNLSLTVEYSPEYVKATAQSSTVNENQTFSLDCSAQSNPSVTSFTWMKMNDGQGSLVGSEQRYSVNAASPSDAGLYRCAARNEIGTGTSQQVEVKVTYAPKHTAIIKGGEQQLSDGRRSLTLACISLCYPPATYVWYSKTDGREILTSQSQILTVNSEEAGEYYCTARNDLGQRSSEPIRPFDDVLGNSHGTIVYTMNIVKLFLIFCILLTFLHLFVFFRRRRNESVQDRDSWKDGARENVMSETGLEEPLRSRGVLSPDLPCRPKAQQLHPHADVT